MNHIPSFKSLKYLSKDKWLCKQIPYENNIHTIDILQDYSFSIYSWLQSQDFICNTPQESFSQELYSHLYTHYYKYSPTKQYTLQNITDIDLFTLQYLETIQKLFSKLISISNHYQLHLSPTKDFMDFFYFLADHIYYSEDTFSEEENISD